MRSTKLILLGTVFCILAVSVFIAGNMHHTMPSTQNEIGYDGVNWSEIQNLNSTAGEYDGTQTKHTIDGKSLAELKNKINESRKDTNL